VLLGVWIVILALALLQKPDSLQRALFGVQNELGEVEASDAIRTLGRWVGRGREARGLNIVNGTYMLRRNSSAATSPEALALNDGVL